MLSKPEEAPSELFYAIGKQLSLFSDHFTFAKRLWKQSSNFLDASPPPTPPHPQKSLKFLDIDTSFSFYKCLQDDNGATQLLKF